jgi:hypothetical protein
VRLDFRRMVRHGPHRFRPVGSHSTWRSSTGQRFSHSSWSHIWSATPIVLR